MQLIALASNRGKDTFLDQTFAEFDPERIVDVQDGNRDATGRRAAHETGPLPAEVTRPFMATGIEQGGQLASLRGPAADVLPLE